MKYFIYVIQDKINYLNEASVCIVSRLPLCRWNIPLWNNKLPPRHETPQAKKLSALSLIWVFLARSGSIISHCAECWHVSANLWALFTAMNLFFPPIAGSGCHHSWLVVCLEISCWKPVYSLYEQAHVRHHVVADNWIYRICMMLFYWLCLPPWYQDC